MPRDRLGPAFDDLLSAARGGAGWAFERLFETLAGPVAGYFRAHGAPEPEDLTSEVFLRAFTKLECFNGGEQEFRAWVFTIAHHQLIDDRRRRARSDARTASVNPAEARTAASAEDQALAALGDLRVAELLRSLSHDRRDVLLLRIVGDLTVEQTAAVLGKRPGAVKALQRRALGDLRRRVQPSGVPL